MHDVAILGSLRRENGADRAYAAVVNQPRSNNLIAPPNAAGLLSLDVAQRAVQDAFK